MIGRTLGHYEIVGKLGEGGMGAVYRARDTRLDRDVALKLLPDYVAGDPEKIARLEREARLLASLNHPNVATLHGLERSDGLTYLVMELVSGQTLSEKIAVGSLSLGECLDVFHQVAEALEAAHEKGVVHRDLKPANIIVASEGRAKVLDFGLAKSVVDEATPPDLSKSPTLTRMGTEQGIVFGTASYMSPEQARGKALDRRTDVWSFGCVFYEALTGRLAFPGETASDIIAAILEREPEWDALPAPTPSSVRALLRRCLRKDPRRRLQHIGDARVEIEEARQEPPAERAARTPLPWAPVALAAGIVLGALIWNLAGPRGETERGISRLSVDVPSEQALTAWNDPAVAISPDGKKIVYVGGSATERRLYLRPIDSLEASAIPGTEGAGAAFFSPDGEWLAFYGAGRLEKVSLDSGFPITLCDVPNGWGASWGPTDTIAITQRDNAGISLVRASGGGCKTVTSPDAEQGEMAHHWPQFLPGGRALLFTIMTTEGSPRIGLVDIDGDRVARHRILIDEGFYARYAPTGHLIYAREGILLAAPFDLERGEVTGESIPLRERVRTNPAAGTGHYAISLTGTLVYVPHAPDGRSLLWLDRTGAASTITETRRAYEDPRLSPDGGRLALTIRDEGLHVWVYEIARDAFMQLTFGPDDEQAPLWTPDGARLTFRRGGASNLFWVLADGSAPEERLTTSERLQRAESWSPDGKTLVYSELAPDTDHDIWLLDVGTNNEPRPFLQTTFAERVASVAPYGRFLAYLSNETDQWEVYVREFPGPGGRWQISTEGGRQPVWARNGSEIYYRNGDKMMVVPVRTEPSFSAGRPVELFERRFSDPTYASPQYDVAPDGEHFVVIREEPPRIQIVLNWFEELAERVPPRSR